MRIVQCVVVGCKRLESTYNEDAPQSDIDIVAPYDTHRTHEENAYCVTKRNAPKSQTYEMVRYS